MKLINLGLEDEQQQEVDLNPDNTQQAIDAVENQDSTEPEKVIQVANYKEELAALRAKNKDAEGSDTPGDTETTDEGSSEESSEENPDSQDAAESDDENPEEDSSTEESTEESEEQDTEEELAQEQYIQEGFKSVNKALESIQVMSKYHRMLSKRSDLGGINQATAIIITNALEAHSQNCGYVAKNVPALEDFQGYTSAVVSTKKLKVAIEGFLDDVWEAIKKFFKSVWTWVMDILLPKKPMTPATPKEKSEEVKKLEALVVKLHEQLQNVDRQREKDEERNKKAERQELARGIANVVFKSSDKGSFTEITQNAIELADVIRTARALTEKITEEIQQIAMASNSGVALDIEKFTFTKEDAAGFTFEELNRAKSHVVYEAVTSEIFGGISGKFIFAGSDAKKVAEKVGQAAALKELGSQGYKLVSTKGKGNFPAYLPKLDGSEIDQVSKMVVEVSTCYAELTKIQEMLGGSAKIVKSFFENRQPASWQQLDKESVAILQAQVNFVGMIEATLTSGYKTIDVHLNNYVNANKKLLALFIS